MAIEHIKLSQQGKDQLIKLKRVTGIEQWNVLCRWALCVSMAEKGAPSFKKIPADSNVEMSWKVFGGRYADVYLALLKERCVRRPAGIHLLATTGTAVGPNLRCSSPSRIKCNGQVVRRVGRTKTHLPGGTGEQTG